MSDEEEKERVGRKLAVLNNEKDPLFWVELGQERTGRKTADRHGRKAGERQSKQGEERVTSRQTSSYGSPDQEGEQPNFDAIFHADFQKLSISCPQRSFPSLNQIHPEAPPSKISPKKQYQTAQNLAHHQNVSAKPFSISFCQYSNLDYVQPLHVYNLFSNYGNINQIMVDRNTSEIIIQFENESYARQATLHLQSMPFFGSALKIRESSNQHFLNEEHGQLSIMLFKKKHRRFDCPKQIEVISPSQTLHLSNIKNSVEYQYTVQEMVQPYGSILNITFKQSKQSKNMNICFVQMATIEESIRVLTNLHNCLIDKNQLKISFCRTNLLPN